MRISNFEAAPSINYGHVFEIHCFTFKLALKSLKICDGDGDCDIEAL